MENLTTLWIPLLIGLLTLIAIVKLRNGETKFQNLPPGPRNWPVLGALFEMEPELHKVLIKMASKWGPIAYFRLGVQTFVVISSAEAAEEVLKQKDAEFCDRVAPMTRSCSKYVGFDGTVYPFADNKDLQPYRKLSIAKVFSLSKIKTYEKLRAQEATVMVEQLFRVIESSKGSGDVPPMEVRPIATAMARNILSFLILGMRLDDIPPKDELKDFPQVMDGFFKYNMSFNLADYYPSLTWLDPQGLLKKMKDYEKRERKFFGRILERYRQALKQKRESGKWNDDADESTNLVDILLLAQEQDSKLTDDGLMGSILSWWVAGIHTTGSQIEWLLLELARHPEMCRQLQQEIDAVVGKERLLEEADLPALPYLNAVFLETMRLHGVAPYSFPHVNKKPSTLCGYDIPAKTAVLVNFYTIARDPKTWKDAQAFNPDRFMPGGQSFSSPPMRANGNLQYHLLPFSAGRRVCPGDNWGIVMLLLIAGTLVHAFDWGHATGSAEDLTIEEKGAFNMHPAQPLYLIPRPRLSSNVYKSNII